jgi:hypothetical protein
MLFMMMFPTQLSYSTPYQPPLKWALRWCGSVAERHRNDNIMNAKCGQFEAVMGAGATTHP